MLKGRQIVDDEEVVFIYLFIFFESLLVVGAKVRMVVVVLVITTHGISRLLSSHIPPTFQLKKEAKAENGERDNEMCKKLMVTNLFP